VKVVFTLTAIVSISIAGAFLKEDLGYRLKKSSPEHAAIVLAELTDQQSSLNSIEAYYELLKNTDPMTGVDNKVKIQDFAVAALEQQTKIKATQGNYSLKAILSCYKNEQVYRYHIPELTQEQISRYRVKILHWLEERRPH
jgi:hypothetical protein